MSHRCPTVEPLYLDGMAVLRLSARTRLRIITDLGVVTVACAPTDAGDLDRVLIDVQPIEVAGWEPAPARTLELVAARRPLVRETHHRPPPVPAVALATKETP
jgi:hypothetical protein